VDPERNLLAVRGSVPGANKCLVLVRKARKQ
jgi:ribosomal protein L3